MDRERLLATLIGSNICTTEQFKAFFTGFTEASTRFLVVDAGIGQSSVDAKLKGKSRSRSRCQLHINNSFSYAEYIETYARFPQTLRLILGGMAY